MLPLKIVPVEWDRHIDTIVNVIEPAAWRHINSEEAGKKALLDHDRVLPHPYEPL